MIIKAALAFILAGVLIPAWSSEDSASKPPADTKLTASQLSINQPATHLPKKETSKEPKIIKVCLANTRDDIDINKRCVAEAGLKDTVQVYVDHLDQLLTNSKSEKKDIHLFIDGMELQGVKASVVDNNSIQFFLWNETPKEIFDDPIQRRVWATAFGFRDRWELRHPSLIKVGISGAEPEGPAARLTLIRMRHGGPLFLSVLIALVLVYWVSAKKGAFWDRGSLDYESTKNEFRGHAVSLARVQMGWWFFLVVAAFFYIWTVIGYMPDLPASVLGLIGIASGTALGAAVIDIGKREQAGSKLVEAEKKLSELQQARTKINSELDAMNTTTPTEDFTAKKTELAAAVTQVSIQSQEVNRLKVQQSAVASTGSWFFDMLSDANGISFHRLQMGIWTVVLGLVFIDEVASNLALPVFHESLLALMGISAGTYLGFKFPEQQPVQD